MTDNNQRVNEQAERELFEKWCGEDKTPGWVENIDRHGDGYVKVVTDMAWEAWQARAAIEQAAPEAPAAAPAAESVKTWQRITAPGQVKVGDKLRFTIGDSKYNETVKLVLDAGTDREELIYNRRMNYYVITKNAMTGFGSSKNVEFLPKGAQQSTKESTNG